MFTMIFSAIAYTLMLTGAAARLENSPVYGHVDEWLASRSSITNTNKNSDACLGCSGGVCTLLPPTGSGFPCYQGANKDANKCYNTVSYIFLFLAELIRTGSPFTRRFYCCLRCVYGLWLHYIPSK